MMKLLGNAIIVFLVGIIPVMVIDSVVERKLNEVFVNMCDWGFTMEECVVIDQEYYLARYPGFEPLPIEQAVNNFNRPPDDLDDHIDSVASWNRFATWYVRIWFGMVLVGFVAWWFLGRKKKKAAG